MKSPYSVLSILVHRLGSYGKSRTRQLLKSRPDLSCCSKAVLSYVDYLTINILNALFI